MQRRRFLAVAATTGGLGLASTPSIAAATPDSRPMRFYSAASQLAADYAPLSDPSIAVVRAEPTASGVSTQEDAVEYPSDVPIPLVSIDGPVAGFGAMLGPDAGRFDASENFEYRNAGAVLRIWDALVDGERVLWDEGHGQYWDLGKFGRFAALAADRGYDVAPTETIDRDALSSTDALVIATPPRPFSSTELDALAAFVADGGALFLHDQAGFRGLDATANLNAIADRLALAFRFNADEVTDETHNAGAAFVPLTARYSGPLAD